jgi:hypothetical protein
MDLKVHSQNTLNLYKVLLLTVKTERQRINILVQYIKVVNLIIFLNSVMDSNSNIRIITINEYKINQHKLQL